MLSCKHMCRAVTCLTHAVLAVGMLPASISPSSSVWTCGQRAVPGATSMPQSNTYMQNHLAHKDVSLFILLLVHDHALH
jgi:hypothetical protein